MGPRARHVYDVLVGRVRSGKLAPGARLPAHTRLAATFGVAPLTIRHVLAELESDALIVRERGRGTFVRADAGTEVLIVARSDRTQAAVLQCVRQSRQRAVIAATSAEGLAALEREPAVILLVVDLALPTARAGLTFVRAARRLRSGLPIAVLAPSPGQTTRLEHTVAPPLRIVGQPLDEPLTQVLNSISPPPSSRLGAATTIPSTPFVADLMERYLVVALSGDTGTARQLLLHDGSVSGAPVADILLGVVQSAQHRVGELWQHNRISIAREHLATGVAATLMAELAASATRAPSTAVRVLVACVEGELHALGARMVADLLELDGCIVRFLGANVPNDSLLALIRDEPPDLLVLSVTMPEYLHQLRQVVAGVRAIQHTRFPIFVGGRALASVPELIRQIDIDLAANDARETVEYARRVRVGRG